jgi:hypothetical protein
MCLEYYPPNVITTVRTIVICGCDVLTVLPSVLILLENHVSVKWLGVSGDVAVYPPVGRSCS